MIGIKKVSDGQMGNRLFQYHFLKQIAKKTECEYFHCSLPDSVYFLGMEKRRRNIWSLKRPIKLTKEDIVKQKSNEFIEFVKYENNKGRDIILVPPILGDLFFDYLFYNPNEFLKIRPEYKLKINNLDENNSIVGIHFRGTDLHSWDRNTILEPEYYLKAIQHLSKEIKDAFEFVLFTDDENLPAYIETKKYLADRNFRYNIGQISLPPIYDFYQMSQCDYLISSPSTFSIFAGVLGKEKKIIHSEKWIKYALNRNDLFWKKLIDYNNRYYKIWKTF